MTSKEFDRVANAIRPQLVRIAQNISKNRDDAEDAVQDTLIETWEYSRDHQIINLKAFLLSGTRLRALRALAHKKRREEIVSFIPLEDFTASELQVWTHNDTCFTQYIAGEKGTILQSCIADLCKQARLTEKQRSRLWSFACDQRTMQEIGDREGVSLNAVYQCINSARLSLRRAAERMEVVM